MSMASSCCNSPSSFGVALSPAPSLASSVSTSLFLGKGVRLACPLQGSIRTSFQTVRARTTTEETSSTSTTTESSLQTDELLADLKAKWDGIENKTNVFLYGGGTLVALWLSSTIIGAVNSVPLLPKVLELVGLGYTGWFVYRYILFKESRKELVSDIEELKSKIAGTEE